MCTFATSGALALARPETCDEDHFGRPSFRVRGRIFATAPDPEHLRVASPELVRDLLAAAWRRKAPRALLKPPSA